MKCKTLASTETKILQAAELLFIKNGFKATTIRNIAQAAHVNVALINYHFRSKENLYKELISNKVELLYALLDSILQDTSLRGFEKLEIFIDRYAELIYANTMIPRLIMREMTMDSDIAQWFIVEKLKPAFSKIHHIVQEAIADGSLRNDIDISVLLPSIIANIIFNAVAAPALKMLFKKKPSELLQSKERIEEIKHVIYFGIKKM